MDEYCDLFKRSRSDCAPKTRLREGCVTCVVFAVALLSTRQRSFSLCVKPSILERKEYLECILFAVDNQKEAIGQKYLLGIKLGTTNTCVANETDKGRLVVYVSV